MHPLSPLVALVVSLPPALSASVVDFLNFTSPSPYIFHSLATLLQTYPQTLFPNGHTIASVTVPRHTLMYHGRHDNDAVPSPEWLAFDIEMAYGIMGNMPDSRMFTYRTTKDVKAVYFDGTSANLMGEGTKSQMVLLYNGTEKIPKRGGWGPPGGGKGRGGHREEEHEHEHEILGEDDEGPPRRSPGGRPGGPGRWNPLEDEYFRARGLCQWLKERGLGGQGWGYEGIVRMNAGFELIWCDFESPSLKLVSNLNVSAPRLEAPENDSMAGFQGPAHEHQGRLRALEDEGPHGPGMTDPGEPFRGSANWFWFTAAAKRYFGEGRTKLNACSLFSFYDPQLRSQTVSRSGDEVKALNLTEDGSWESPEDDAARSVALKELMRRRRYHQLDNVEKTDGTYMRQTLEQRLRDSLRGTACESVDWPYVAQQVMTDYADNLQDLVLALQQFDSSTEGDYMAIRAWLHSLRQITHWFLMPFLEYPSDRPYDKQALERHFTMDSSLTADTMERCQNQYDIAEDSLDPEETAAYQAVKDVLASICSTAVDVGFGVEYQWLLRFNEEFPGDEWSSAGGSDLPAKIAGWKEKVEELMAWLGWVDKWTTCEDACGTGEVCYIPMWPTSGFPPRRGPPPGGPHGEPKASDAPRFHWGEWDHYLWEPVCVNASSYPPE